MRFIDKMKRNRVVVEMRLFLRLTLHSFLDERRRSKHRFNQGEIPSGSVYVCYRCWFFWLVCLSAFKCAVVECYTWNISYNVTQSRKPNVEYSLYDNLIPQKPRFVIETLLGRRTQSLRGYLIEKIGFNEFLCVGVSFIVCFLNATIFWEQ